MLHKLKNFIKFSNVKNSEIVFRQIFRTKLIINFVVKREVINDKKK